MRKVKFTVKERQEGERCFVVEEDEGIMFELQPPADIKHAREVAAFLNQNLDELCYDTTRDEYPPMPLKG